MPPVLRRLSVAILIAVTAVTVAVVPTIGGIATWKVVLGLIGATIFVMAGFGRKG